MLAWHTTGIWDNPQDFGLTMVKDVDIADSYEFDMIAIWKTEDGRYLIGTDSGCSCPTPFENTKVEDLTEVRTLADVADFARATWSDSYYDEQEREEGVARLVDRLELG